MAGGVDDLARVQHDVADAHVLAAAADVLAARDGALDRDGAAGAAVVLEPARHLDHHDGVGALGHRRAGHDAASPRPAPTSRSRHDAGGMCSTTRSTTGASAVAPATSAARTA